MKTYSEFRPTGFDTQGLGLDDRQGWLVAPVAQNRDSEALSRSNFRTVLAALGGESDTVEVHRFGHWACGWFEIMIVAPDSEAAKTAEEIESVLADYPVFDDEDYSREEQEQADETWRNCYDDEGRIEYIRDNRSQFEFHSLAEMMACVRGKFFAGYASELCS